MNPAPPLDAAPFVPLPFPPVGEVVTQPKVEITGQTVEWYRNWADLLERNAVERATAGAECLAAFQKLRAQAEGYRAYAALLCPHCGKPPEDDGDHTCPCPYSDGDCPDHKAAGGAS